MFRAGTSDRKAIEEVWDRGTYEKPRLGFTVQSGERWIDGGANVGGFSRLVLESGGSVTAYEPEPGNFSLLERNAVGAVCERKCLTLGGGDVRLNVQAKPLQQRRHSIRFARRGSVPLIVPSVAFEDAIVGHDGCKLNIEGEEIAILSSRPSLGGLQKLVFEWSFDVDDRCETLRGVLEWLHGSFANVRTSRTIVGDRWVWYPPNVFCFAWGRLAG